MGDIELIYLTTPPESIAYVKFIFESYEEVGILRTIDRQKAVIVLLAMRDFVESARGILESIQQDVPLQEIRQPEDMPDDWFMKELKNDTSIDDRCCTEDNGKI